MTHSVAVRQNGPQLAATQCIFGTDGQIQRLRTVFAGWGRGVGKSYWRRQIWYTLIALLDGRLRTDALEPFHGVRITSLAPTLKQWKEINWAGIEEELAPQGKWGFLGGKLDRQTGHIKFPGGSMVRPFPATEYNARTARGMRTDVLDGDEIDDIPASVYDGVAVPWLSEPWSLGLQLLSGTPTKGRHGLWWRLLKSGELGEKVRTGAISNEDALATDSAQALLSVLLELPENEWPDGLPDDPEDAALMLLGSSYSFHATYKDAPETVSALAVARAKATTPESTFKREWLSDPDAGEGLVFGGVWDETFHVRQAPPLAHFAELHVGMDHGFEDPGVLLRCGILGHGEDAVLWAFDELYEPGQPNHVWDTRAATWRNGRFWPDTSRADRVHDLVTLGLNVGETDRGPGSILAGIARIADLLFPRPVTYVGPAFHEVTERRSRLFVDPRCKNLIREFGTYKRRKRADGSFDEDPEDRNNHAIDALRYVVLGRFGRLGTGRREHQR